MYNSRFSRLLLLIVLVFSFQAARADGWTDFRVGTADSKPTLSLEGVYADGINLYSATYRFGTDFLDRDEYRELSFAYGRRYVQKYGATTVQAGIGLFEIEDDDFKRVLEPTIPLSATFVLGKYLGLSGNVFLNLNRIEPLSGFEQGIALGKFN